MAAARQVARTFKSFMLGLALVLVMWLAAGPTLSAWWHLTHGNHFDYKGMTVLVPKHSYMRYTSSGPCIETLSPGAPMFNRPYGMIFISKAIGSFSKAKHYPAFVDEMKKVAGKTGHQLTASETVPLGGHSAFCLEFSRGGKQPHRMMQCVVDGSDLFLTFEGDPRYLPDVTQILRSMFPMQQPARS